MPATPQPPDPTPDVEPDHYFTAEPASAAERRTLDVRLAGRDVTVHTAAGLERTATAFRALTDASLALGGSFFLSS